MPDFRGIGVDSQLTSFFINGIGYLTTLIRANLSGELNYINCNIVEKLFQTYTNSCFHKNLKRQSASVQHCLNAHTAYYNYPRNYQALDNQPLPEPLKQSDSSNFWSHSRISFSVTLEYQIPPIHLGTSPEYSRHLASQLANQI